MVPNQILSLIINVALLLIFIVAPIFVVIQHVLRLERVENNLLSRGVAIFVYTEEINTAKEIESGEIFWTLFKKALPSG